MGVTRTLCAKVLIFKIILDYLSENIFEYNVCANAAFRHCILNTEAELVCYMKRQKMIQMKKGFFSVIIILFISGIITSGCRKHAPSPLTTNPSMTANIGSYTFVAATVVTSILDTQIHDSTTTLDITGNTSDVAHPYDKMQVSITKYKGAKGVYSIVESHASAFYLHSGIKSVALGGVVAITSITSNTITGYFSFNTTDTVNVVNGAFTANKP